MNESEEFPSDILDPPVDRHIYEFSTGYIAIVGILGVSGNLSVLVSFIRNKNLRTEINIVMINMIVSELISAGFGSPVVLMASIQRGWKMGKIFCNITGFILTTDGMVTIYSLAALGMLRWSMLTRQPHEQPWGGRTVATIVWLLAFSMSLPPLLGFSYYYPDPSGFTCAPVWSDEHGKGYHWYLLTLGFFIPNFTMIVSYLNIMYQQRKNTRNFQRRFQTTSNRALKNRLKQERKLTINVVLMCVFFNLSWVSYAIVSILRTSGHQVSTSLMAIAVLMTKSGTCWNPVIHVFCNREFRNYVLPGVVVRILEQCQSADNDANPSTTNVITQPTHFDQTTDARELQRVRNMSNKSDEDGNITDSRLSLLSYFSPLPLRSPFSVLKSRQGEPPPVIIELEQIRRPDQNNQSEDMPEEFRVRYTSPNFHSLNESNEETESTPMLTRRRESSVAQNEQKTNQYGHSTSV